MPSAEIKKQIIQLDISGDANDGDPATLPEHYPAPPRLNKATDAATKAASDTPLFDKLAGTSLAVPAAASTAQAVAKSFNHVVTRLVVSKRDKLTFETNLDLEGLKITGQGHLEIFAQANVLDDNGASVANGNAANISCEIRLNAQNTLEAHFPATATEPPFTEPVPANGAFGRRATGPGGGVELSPNNYRIEMDLRLLAFAPIDPHSTAEVEKGTVAVKLR